MRKWLILAVAVVVLTLALVSLAVAQPVDCPPNFSLEAVADVSPECAAADRDSDKYVCQLTLRPDVCIDNVIPE